MHTPLRLVIMVLLAAAFLSGCELLYVATGKGKQKALHKFEKNQRVLVLVDAREGVSLPPDFTNNLAEKVGSHLFRNKAADNMISQDRVYALQAKDPAAYKKMNIAEVIRATDADVAIYLYLTRVLTTTSVDGTVNLQAEAELFAKVVDRDGNRVWPSDAAGIRIVASVDPTFTNEKPTADVLKELTDLLTLRTGRMFHDYSLEDRQMIR